MEKSWESITRKVRGERGMNAATLSTFGANETLAKKLKGFGAKILARRAGGCSTRTAENWLSGENGPVWKHIVAMLNDDELAPHVLSAAGREDLARAAKIESLNRRIEALKAEEQRHEREAYAIRKDMEVGG